MTRKDYVLIAGALRDARCYFSDQTSEVNSGLDRAAAAIAHVLGRDNPRFDRARFLDACDFKKDKPCLSLR